MIKIMDWSIFWRGVKNFFGILKYKKHTHLLLKTFLIFSSKVYKLEYYFFPIILILSNSSLNLENVFTRILFLKINV